jgi:alpha-galactosidase
VKLEGLDAHKNYSVKEINLYPGSKSACPENSKTYSGSYLMKVGLTVSNATPLNSSVFEMEGVE